MKTIADLWLETYAYISEIEIKSAKPDQTGKRPTRPWQGFINLSSLINHPEILSDTNRIYASTVNPSKKKIVMIDGFPYAKVKPSYLISMGTMNNSYRGIYNKLLQLFSEECIHLCWPDIELKNRNEQTLRQNRREFNEFRKELKKIPRGERQLHAEVLHITQNKSVTQFIRERRNLGR